MATYVKTSGYARICRPGAGPIVRNAALGWGMQVSHSGELPRENEACRTMKVRAAQWRLVSGVYDSEELLDAVVEKALGDLTRQDHALGTPHEERRTDVALSCPDEGKA